MFPCAGYLSRCLDAWAFAVASLKNLKTSVAALRSADCCKARRQQKFLVRSAWAGWARCCREGGPRRSLQYAGLWRILRHAGSRLSFREQAAAVFKALAACRDSMRRLRRLRVASLLSLQRRSFLSWRSGKTTVSSVSPRLQLQRSLTCTRVLWAWRSTCLLLKNDEMSRKNDEMSRKVDFLNLHLQKVRRTAEAVRDQNRRIVLMAVLEVWWDAMPAKPTASRRDASLQQAVRQDRSFPSFGSRPSALEYTRSRPLLDGFRGVRDW